RSEPGRGGAGAPARAAAIAHRPRRSHRDRRGEPARPRPRGDAAARRPAHPRGDTGRASGPRRAGLAPDVPEAPLRVAAPPCEGPRLGNPTNEPNGPDSSLRSDKKEKGRKGWSEEASSETDYCIPCSLFP